ncbi:MAG: MMPL family transporter [Bacteriovorax sp.]|nr:MMPL family transporter [Bacteriovorax sp.]
MKKLLQLNLKFYWIAPIFLILFAFFGVRYSSKLKINLDLLGLLPKNSESIQEMNHVVSKVGGGGYIIVLVGPITNPESKLNLIDEKIKNIKDVKYTYYEREEFMLKDKALYIMPRKDFKKLTEYARIIFSKTAVDTTGLGLVDESDREDQLKEANKFFNKLKKATSSERYFVSADKKYAMLLVRPTFDSTNLAKSKELAEKINAGIESLFGQNQETKFPFSLSGRYVEKAEEVRQFENDIYKTGIISNIAITILLVWGLGTFRGALTTVIVVASAMCVTGGLAYFAVGQINILTGFLLAILSGLGSKFGIHLIRRYYQERHKGADKETATRNTYFHLSRRGLFSSALTSSCSFFILAYSNFRGFSELGIIAGIGIIVIYLVFVLSFPMIAKFLPERSAISRRSRFPLGKYPIKLSWIKFLPLFIPLFIYGLASAYFEYDFDKLHNFPPELQKINQLTDTIFGRAISPSAILARDKEQVIALTDWLRSDENAATVDQVVSIYDLVPPDMKKRSKRLKMLRSYVYKVDAKELEKNTGISKENIYKWIDAPMYDRSIIPRAINDNFGIDGNIIIVFPKEKQSNYDNITRYAHTLSQAKKEFPGMEVGSDTLVFAEILNHIIEDGKLVLVFFLLGAFFIFWMDFKNIKDALLLEAQLIFCVILLIAFMGIAHVPFTILNVAMIPEVLAAGIDMGVHIRHREKEGHTSLASAKLISHAVQLGAFTSILGFGSLLFTSSKMLQGIAWISILGQVSAYFVCMLAFPLIRDFLSKHYKKV